VNNLVNELDKIKISQQQKSAKNKNQLKTKVSQQTW
jgi:hypothetical protein